MGVDVEERTIRAFVEKSKQDRCCSFLSQPKRRKVFTKELAHFRWLDPRFAHDVSSVDTRDYKTLSSFLRTRGAGKTVWAISESAAIDGTELPLEDALLHVMGYGLGTILSCVPGRLAFFCGEERHSERVLER